MTGGDENEDSCHYMTIDKATQYASLDGMYFFDDIFVCISNGFNRSIIALERSFLFVLP